MRHGNILRTLIFTSFLLGPLLFPLHPNDWPNWRGPHHNGISDERINGSWPTEGPKVLWKASVGTGFSGFAVADGRAYTMGNSNEIDTVFCFDAAAGQKLWSFSYPCRLDALYNEGGPGATPTIDGARVFTFSKRGDLFCVEAKTGNVVWKRNLVAELGITKPRWGFASSPLVQNNLLVLNAGGAGIALDKNDGKTIWLSDTNAAGYATPVPVTIDSENCVAIFGAKQLALVRVSDGKKLWGFPWVTQYDINAPEPVLAGKDKLFISSYDHGCALLQLSAAEPKVIWQNRNMANHFNGCVCLDGCIYGIHGNSDDPKRELRCLDVTSGEVKWQFQGFGLGSLCAARDTLIVLGDHGELAVAPATPKDFRPEARAQVLGGKCWTVPALANGRIYCRNAQGTVVCLQVNAE